MLYLCIRKLMSQLSVRSHRGLEVGLVAINNSEVFTDTYKRLIQNWRTHHQETGTGVKSEASLEITSKQGHKRPDSNKKRLKE